MEKQLKSLYGRKASSQSTQMLLDKREELQQILEEGTQMLSSINSELLIRTQKAGGKLTVGEKTISVVKRLSFSQVSLEVAKKFRAVKKVVDPKVLKPLYEKGVKIEGVTYSEYVMVK